MAGIVERFSQMLRSRTNGTLTGTVNGRKTHFYAYGLRPDREVRSIAADTAAQLWATQPHLRTVIDRIAQEVAALGTHVYKRDGESRERQRSGVVVDLLEDPNPNQTGPEMIYSLVLELALYDEAYMLIAPDEAGRLRMRVIPTTLVEPLTKGQLITGYAINGVFFAPDNILAFSSWTPGTGIRASSKVEALRTILDSEHAAHSRRRDVLTKGPRVGGIISRPKDAPRWSDAARGNFDAMWEAFQPGGERSGDAVILEDGMTYTAPEFSADASGYRDGATLSLSTVAQVYQIHPGIFGVPGSTSYQGVREVRRSLIGDSLAWIIKRIEARFTKVLLPLLGESAETYVEFNVEGKLRGSFEEQAVILRQAVGGPYLTVNEARALQNRRDIDGGDDLIRPLNVTTDGESNRSPEDDLAQQDGMKADIIARFKQRRDQVIRSKGAGTPVDVDRWLRELTEDGETAGIPFTAHEVIEANRDIL